MRSRLAATALVSALVAVAAPVDEAQAAQQEATVYRTAHKPGTVRVAVTPPPAPSLMEPADDVADDADDAETLIEQALATSPDDAELQFWCGRVMGVQAQQAFLSALSYAKRSLACFQQAVALAPDKVDYRIGLMRFYLGAPSFAGVVPELAWFLVDAIKVISYLP